MILTLDQLLKIMPNAHSRVARFIAPINAAAEEFEIDRPRRLAAFLAQVAHETMQLKFTKEIWGPTAQQMKYERRLDHPWPPTAMDHANRVAWTLGNSEPGDGEKFLGRGLLQTTGRANYDHAGTALNLDLLNHPELLEQPEHGCRSSALFWKRHGLNELADDMRFDEITKTINGGLTGAAERRGYYEAALAAVGESVEVA